jgi:hypothetical protein
MTYPVRGAGLHTDSAASLTARPRVPIHTAAIRIRLEVN